MSFIFDGTDDRVELASAETWPTSYTIVAWIKPDATGSVSTIHGAYHQSNGTPAIFCITNGSTTARLRLLQDFSTSIGRWVGTDDSITFGAWQGVAVTYNASSPSNDPIFYRKAEGGSIVTQTTTETDAPAGTQVTNQDTWWVGGVFTSFLFDGKIAYVRMFPSILTEAQIDTEFSNAIAQQAEEIDLPMDTDLLDDSGNAHNGTATGATQDSDMPNLGGGGGGGGVAPKVIYALGTSPLEGVR